MHSAHTHGLGCAQAAHTAPCRNGHWVKSWRALAPCRGRVVAVTGHVARARFRVASPPPITIQKLYRNPTPAMRTAHRVTRAPGRIAGRVATYCCHVTTLYRSPAGAILRYKQSPPTTIQFLYCNSPVARPCTRAHAAYLCAQAGRIVAPLGRIAGPYRNVLLRAPVPARQYRGTPGCAQLPYVTIQFVVS